MLKFTIRELLLLTLVVGLGVGWWVDHRDKVRHRENERIYRDALQNQLDWFHHETGRPTAVKLENGEVLQSTIDRVFMGGSS